MWRGVCKYEESIFIGVKGAKCKTKSSLGGKLDVSGLVHCLSHASKCPKKIILVISCFTS